MTKFFRARVTAWLDFRLVADDEDEARAMVEDLMAHAEIDPYQIMDWEVDEIEEGLEEDE